MPRSIPHGDFFANLTIVVCDQILVAVARPQTRRLFDGLNLTNVLNRTRSYVSAHFAIWRGLNSHRLPTDALNPIPVKEFVSTDHVVVSGINVSCVDLWR